MRERVPTEKIAMRSLGRARHDAEAIESGVGIGPLPCFIGDQNPNLRRLSPPNPEFGTGLWILTHPDLRQAPRVRALMDYFGQEISRRGKLVEGSEPLRQHQRPRNNALGSALSRSPPPMRPRTLPLTIARPTSRSRSSSGIVCVIAASLALSRSVASRVHACLRSR